VPIHQQHVHWGVAVISIQERTLQYYDSMHIGGMDILKALLEYLQDEHKEREGKPLNVAEWKLVPCCPITTPRQMGDDCGVCTILFTDLLYLNEPLTFNGSQIAKFHVRKRLALAILRKQPVVDASTEMMEHYYGYLHSLYVSNELCKQNDGTVKGPESDQNEKGGEKSECEETKMNEEIGVIIGNNDSEDKDTEKVHERETADTRTQPDHADVTGAKEAKHDVPGMTSTTTQHMRLARELRRLGNDGAMPLVMVERTRRHHEVTKQDTKALGELDKHMTHHGKRKRS
jgi:Ulp1 protease family, C-terminal catalytic domain